MQGRRLVTVLWLSAVTTAAPVLAGSIVRAQTGVVRGAGSNAPGVSSDTPLLPEDSTIAPGVPANGTLEIAPRVVAAPSPAPQANPPTGDSVDEAVSDATGTADDAV